MTNKQLLEYAAKAAGYKVVGYKKEIGLFLATEAWPMSGEYWSPLTDDGDALRLAVKLNLGLVHGWEGLGEIAVATVWISYEAKCIAEEIKANDPYAATRRAIVRAAAEIGKGMGND